MRLITLRDSDKHYVAVADGTGTNLLGWIAAEHRLLLESGERVEIVGLVVDRAARRKGIGQALVASVESWAALGGAANVFVRSNVTRDESHSFYASLGYGRTKTQHAYTRRIPAGPSSSVTAPGS